eukprot:249645_1
MSVFTLACDAVPSLRRYTKCNRVNVLSFCFLILALFTIWCYLLLSGVDIDVLRYSMPTVLLLTATNISTLSNGSYVQNISVQEYIYFTDEPYNDSDSQYCGRVWLYKHHNIVLSITNKHQFTHPHQPIYLQQMSHSHPKRYTEQTVVIEQVNRMNPSFDCSDLTIFVRISGAETLGGFASVAHNTKHECFWWFKFRITLPGNYSIIARILYYKGHLDFDNNKCELQLNAGWKSSNSNISTQDAYNKPELFDDPLISTRIDWRLQFYDRHYSCCEWCSRLPTETCSKWMSGPGFGRRNDRCNMFHDEHSIYNTDSNNRITSIAMPKEKNLTQWFAGTSRNEDTAWYLGSKLSVTPSQRICFSGNWRNYDVIHNSNFSFLIYDDKDHLDPLNGTLPLCSLRDIKEDTGLSSNRRFGRWITSKLYNNDAVGCIVGKYFDEYNETEVMEASYLCLIHSYQYMWHNTYRRWPSNFWFPYKCSLKWFHSINEAIDLIWQRGLRKIYWTGDSMSRDLQTMFYQMAPRRLVFSGSDETFCRQDRFNTSSDKLLLCYNRAMQRFVAQAKPQVIVDNFNLLHQLWHNNMSDIEQNLDTNLRIYNEWIESAYGKDSRWPMKFFVNAPMIMAEREYHVTGSRAVLVNQIVMKKCRHYGWFVLPYADLSEAQMYDSSREGMHPEGPVKMEMVRIFLHMILQYA